MPISPDEATTSLPMRSTLEWPLPLPSGRTVPAERKSPVRKDGKSYASQQN